MKRHRFQTSVLGQTQNPSQRSKLINFIRAETGWRPREDKSASKYPGCNLSYTRSCCSVIWFTFVSYLDVRPFFKFRFHFPQIIVTILLYSIQSSTLQKPGCLTLDTVFSSFLLVTFLLHMYFLKHCTGKAWWNTEGYRPFQLPFLSVVSEWKTDSRNFTFLYFSFPSLRHNFIIHIIADILDRCTLYTFAL